MKRLRSGGVDREILDIENKYSKTLGQTPLSSDIELFDE